MRELPSSPDADRCLLSSILVGGKSGDPDTALTRVEAIVRPEYFSLPWARFFFTYLRDAVTRKIPWDSVSFFVDLQDRLTPEGAPAVDAIGGVSELADLWDLVPVSGHWEFYAQIVKDKWMRRRIVAWAESATKLAYDEAMSVDAILSKLEGEMLDVHQGRDIQSARPMKEVLLEHITRVEQLHEHRAQRAQGDFDYWNAIATGYPDLDRVFGGIEYGEIIVLSARPGMGKTAILAGLAERISLKDNNPVPGLFISLEMPDEQVITRMTHGASAIMVEKGRSGFYSNHDLVALGQRASQWMERPLYWDGSAEMSAVDLKTRIRQAVQRFGVKVVYLDYAQLITASTKAAEKEERIQIKETMQALKFLAKSLGLVIFVLAQASRGSEENAGREPMMKDLDGSSAMEKFGDRIIFVHRPAKYKPWAKLRDDEIESGGWADEEAYKAFALLLVVKNRHGAEARIPMRFLGAFSRFEPLTTKMYSNNPAERQPLFDA